MSERTLQERYSQLKKIMEDESCSPNKRQQAVKALLKFDDTKEEALAKLEAFADEEQVWAIEYSIRDLKRREKTSSVRGGIDLG